LVGCHHDRLPESLTLCYSDSDAWSDNTVVAGKHFHCDSGAEAAGYQKGSSPLSVETFKCLTSLDTAADQSSYTALTVNSSQENIQFVSLEATSVDAMTTTAAVPDDDDCGGGDDDDDDILCDSHDSLYRLICSRQHSVKDANERRRLSDSLRILLQFFEAEYLIKDNSSSDESFPSFPLYLLEQYTKLMKDEISFYSADGWVSFLVALWWVLISMLQQVLSVCTV